mgnify:CR=1 FL=1
MIQFLKWTVYLAEHGIFLKSTMDRYNHCEDQRMQECFLFLSNALGNLRDIAIIFIRII